MADEISSWPPTDSCRALAASAWWFSVLLVVVRFAVDGGPRSSAGYDPRRKVVLCPHCKKKVRLEPDGWGYCRSCRRDFDGRKAEEA